MADVAMALTAEFGGGFSRSNLYNMINFVERFPDAEIVGALRSQLSWTPWTECTVVNSSPSTTRPSGSCADKNEEQIDLLELTELPPRELLERKLLESIEHARARAFSGERLAPPDADG